MTRADSHTSRSRIRRRRRLGKVRQFVEFGGIRRLSLDQYRNRIRHLYDGPAGAVLALGSLISLHEPLIGHVIRTRAFDVKRFSSILDVGSGAGQILRHLLKHASPRARLVAFDLSAQMLRRARNRLKSDRPFYLAGDLMRMPFADASFACGC